MCVNTMSVRPIRRSSSGLPPTTPFSSTKEPLRLLPFQLHEWQFITSGTVCPPHEPVVIWVQLSNSRAKSESNPGGARKSTSGQREIRKSNTWPNQLPKTVSSPSSLKSQNHQNNFHQSSYCHQHTVLSSNVARSSSNKIRQTSSHCSELLFRACRFHHSKEYCQPPKIGT